MFYKQTPTYNVAQALWEAFPDWRACLSTSLLYSNVSTIQLLNALHGLGWHGLAFQLLSSGVLTAFPIMMLIPIIIKRSKRWLIPTRRHMSRTLAPWHHLAEERAHCRFLFSIWSHWKKYDFRVREVTLGDLHYNFKLQNFSFRWWQPGAGQTRWVNWKLFVGIFHFLSGGIVNDHKIIFQVSLLMSSPLLNPNWSDRWGRSALHRWGWWPRNRSSSTMRKWCEVQILWWDVNLELESNMPGQLRRSRGRWSCFF